MIHISTWIFYRDAQICRVYIFLHIPAQDMFAYFYRGAGSNVGISIRFCTSCKFRPSKISQCNAYFPYWTIRERWKNAREWRFFQSVTILKDSFTDIGKDLTIHASSTKNVLISQIVQSYNDCNHIKKYVDFLVFCNIFAVFINPYFSTKSLSNYLKN